MLLADSVNWLLPEVELGAKLAETPPGSAEVMARLTLPANPFWGVTVTPSLPKVPWTRVSEDWETPRVKDGAAPAVTVRLN